MKKTIMLAGHSKLPQGMAASEIHQTLTITLEIDSKYAVIVDASCTLVTTHAQHFIGQLLKGYSLKDGMDEIIEVLKGHYYGKAQSAILAGIKDAFNQYEQCFKDSKI